MATGPIILRLEAARNKPAFDALIGVAKVMNSLAELAADQEGHRTESGRLALEGAKELEALVKAIANKGLFDVEKVVIFKP